MTPMVSAARREALRKLPIFSECSLEELTRIDALVQETEVGPGEVLVREGTPGRESFLILAGTASVSIGGTEVATLGPGSFFGEMAVLEGKPRSATVTARSQMHLLVVDAASFTQFLEQPGIAVHMLRAIVARLREVQAVRPAPAPPPAGAPQPSAATKTEYTLKLSETELQRFRMMAQRAVYYELDAWTRAGIVPGARVADVGCGPGMISIKLAEIIGPGGRLDAVDREPEAIETARAQLAAAGLTNATVSKGDADATGLEPGVYDALMMRHVLIHNGPIALDIVRHLATLPKPGGCVYLVEADLPGARQIPGTPEIHEEFDRFSQLIAKLGNETGQGSRLAELIRAAGLDLVEFEGRFDIVWLADPETPRRGAAQAARAAMIAHGLATEEDGRRWDEARDRYLEEPEGKYFCIPVFRATARRIA